jgi:hypothetical protein
MPYKFTDVSEERISYLLSKGKPSSQRALCLLVASLPGSLRDPEEGIITFLRNVSKHSTGLTN